jgi:hypothetical protein
MNLFDKEGKMDKVGVAILAGLGIVVMALFSTFTVSTLWTWFIVPFGVQSISMAHACGIGLFASLLQGTRGINNNGGSTKMLVQGVMLNILALIFGGIALQFM